MRTISLTCLLFLLITTAVLADWQQVDTPIDGRLWSVSVASSDVIYACSDQGRVWKSTDGGWTWAEATQLANQDLRGIDFSSETHGTTAAFGGNVYATSDGGLSWDTPLDGWWISHHDVTTPAGDGVAYVAGKNTINQPLITYTTNNWTSWDQQNFLIVINDVGNEGQIVGLAVGDDSMVAACRVFTGEGAICVSTDGGATWTTTWTGSNAVMDVAVHGDLAIAVTLGGAILRSEDGGLSWQQADNTWASLHDVCIVDGQTAWAVGTGGLILESQNGGETWAQVTTGFSDGLEAIDCTEAGYAVAVGFGGTVVVYDPGPAAPVELELLPTNDFVPADGGVVSYDISLTSTLPNAIPGVTFWTTVDAPNGSSYGPLVQQGFTLVPFMDVFITGATQNVPWFAPDGEYSFNGYVGFFPNAALDSSFPFYKGTESIEGSGSRVEGWEAKLPRPASGE